MTAPYGARALLSLLLLVSAAQPLTAQQAPTTRDTRAGATAEVPRAQDGRKILTLESYPEWKRLSGATLSADGRWFSYTVTPLEGDGTLYVKELDGERVHEAPRGTSASFSDDGRWVAWTVPAASGSGGTGTGGRGQPPPQTPQPGGRGGGGGGSRTLQLVDLGDGAKVDIPGVTSFTFVKGSRHLLIRRPKVDANASHDGADLVVRDLAAGTMQVFGNVGAYAVNDAGRLLAFTIDAKDRVGNGVFVYDLDAGTLRPLRTTTADFAGLAWNRAGDALAFLEGETRDGEALRTNTLVLATAVSRASRKVTVFDPEQDASFPRGMVISEYTTPSWTKDGTRLFLGVKPQEPAPPRTNGPQPNVDVWHWRDELPQSVQEVRANQMRRATWPAVYNVASSRVVQLGDEAMPTVQRPADGGRYGIGRMDKPYRGEVAWGGSRADFYWIDFDTGERTLLATGLTRSMGISPNGQWYLYLENGAVFARNLNTLQATNLSQAAGVDFVNIEDDHPYELPAYGLAGWSKDGRQVLLNHRFDIWAVPLAGGRATNLTGGVGEAERIRFRNVNFSGGGFGGGASSSDDETGIDLTKPLMLTAFGERTKRSGYYELRPGGRPTPVIFEDRSIGGVVKAETADRLVFTRQTFTEFPDYWVADTRFSSPRRVTDANPQIAEYAWGAGRVLIDYTDARGNQLQATLALPAGYEPGRRYPMLVYFYERMSDQHHRFQMPAYDDRPHVSTYASDGYLVLQPDVVYTIGRPGTSAVDDVTSAVRTAIELGYADPERIGLQGHSWGGYQSSYIVTQTDMFAAVVTGAPVTNLVSFYNELYRSTGTVQQGIMEVGQVRMGRDSTPWSAHAQYEDQSPLHNAEKITTPFMILHGTADGAVDYHQGLEFFNAARRLGKEVILLSYPDEPHHLGRRENQKDFQVRMKQYFDHYLKGAPAPSWMTEGVPFLRKNIERPTGAVTNGG